MVPDERWDGVAEVAIHLRVGKDSVYRWAEAKGLPARSVGWLLRFRISAVADWVEPGGGEGASEFEAQRGKRVRSAKQRSCR